MDCPFHVVAQPTLGSARLAVDPVRPCSSTARSAHDVAGGSQRVLDLADPQLRRSGRRWPRARRRPRPSTAGAKCSTAPAPPLATTGTSTTARTAAISSRSKPALVPSASIELSRISPAPSSRTAPPTPPRRARPPAPAVRRHLEAARAASGAAPRVDRQHQHLRAEPPGDLADQLRAARSAAVLTPTLSAPARSSRSTSSDRAHAAADRERDEHLLGGAAHHVVRRLAGAARRGDVEEGQLVGALGVVDAGPSRPGRRRRAGR